MISGQTGSELALVALFCVLTIFLFPAVQGPYSAVHGPVSALQATRAAARLRISILQSALRSLRNFPLPTLALLFLICAASTQAAPIDLNQCASVLRC
jgi:hypothetical protein